MEAIYSYQLLEELWCDKYWSDIKRLFRDELFNNEWEPPTDWPELNSTYSTLSRSQLGHDYVCEKLSENPNISWKIITNNPDIEWNYEGISRNPNIKLGIIKTHIHKFNNFGTDLSKNPNITWKFIKKNTNIEWRYDLLSANPCIDWNIIKSNVGKGWSWNWIVRNPSIHHKEIDHNPNKSPYFDFLSKSELGLQSMNWEEFHKYLKDLGVLNLNVNNTHFSPVSWIWHIISRHKSVTWEIINKYPDYSWNPRGVSENMNIKWNIILNNSSYDWDWNYISMNINITPDIVKNNPNLPWNWQMLSKNKSIDLDLYEDYIDNNWNKAYLLSNTMTVAKDRWINTYRLKIIKAFQIQRNWRYFSSNPIYQLAKRRLEREYYS